MDVLRRVMIVDDDRIDRELAAFCLERQHYIVRTLAAGNEAVPAADEFRPQMVLLDFRMPGLNGIETLKALRRLYPAAKLPVVFVTAHISQNGVDEFFEMGAQGVIAKPFNYSTLPDEIEAIWNLWLATFRQQGKA